VARVLGALVLLLAAQSQPSGTIAGRVSEQGSGQPLPRIIVTLLSSDQSRTEVVTDTNGGYRFSGLKPGKYAVGASQDEHRSTYLWQWYGEAAPGTRFGTPQRLNVELNAGESKSNVDIGLTRGLAIEGRITNPWDEPMAGVEVMAARSDDRPVYMRSAVSDDLGHYRVYGVGPGRYRVCAEVRDSSETIAPDGGRLVKTCHPSALEETLAGDVTVTSQDRTGIDIRVQRIGSYTIAGSVIDAAGVPVDGASVAAMPADESDSSAQGTTARGAFVLKGVTPGRYVIRAAVGESHPGDPNPPKREMEIAYVPIEVSGADVAGVAVTLSKPAKVAGRIVLDGETIPRGDRLRLSVHAGTEEPFARYEPRPPFAPVNDDLTFELSGVYPVRVLLRVQGLPDGWVLSSVRYQDRDITHVPTDFAAGARSPIQIALTSRVAKPSARVSDEQGPVVSGYGLAAVPADPAKWQAGLVMVMQMPAPDGTLKLGSWLPGEYVVAALPTADLFLLLRDRSRVTGLATIGTRVTLQKGEARTIDLRLVRLPDKP
jgi:hypothetical protein